MLGMCRTIACGTIQEEVVRRVIKVVIAIAQKLTYMCTCSMGFTNSWKESQSLRQNYTAMHLGATINTNM